MAVIYKSTGLAHGGATDHGKPMPLTIIEERLKDFRVVFRGIDPPHASPVTTYWTHILIEVSTLDPPTPRFKQPGFYEVVGLHPDDAGFLFVKK
jgi:hypothetical protein